MLVRYRVCRCVGSTARRLLSVTRAYSSNKQNSLESLFKELSEELDVPKPTNHVLPDFPTSFDQQPKTPIQPPPATTSQRKAAMWTQEEVDRLKEVVDQNRRGAIESVDWQAVMLHFPHRTLNACRSAFYNKRYTKSNVSLGKRTQHSCLSKQQKLKLIEIIGKLGEHNWAGVSDEMTRLFHVERVPGYYAQLWRCHLCPKAQNAPIWTADDTRRLKQLVQTHGKDPIFMAYKFFPNYTAGMLKIMISRLNTSKENVDPRVYSLKTVAKLIQVS